MDDSETAAACQQIYTETGQIYRQYRHQLEKHDYGFKILYGPPHPKPPVLFVGEQPGGNVADEKANERFGWPAICEYVTEPWALARNMRQMFGAEFLSECVATNANFFRSPNSQTWGAVPHAVRRHLEEFCQAKLLCLISVLKPKQLVFIGHSALGKFGPATPSLYGTNNRVLTKIGKIGLWTATSTLHLSGAQISTDDRRAIATAILDLANSALIAPINSNDNVTPGTFRLPDTQDRNNGVRTEAWPDERYDTPDPKATIKLLDELVELGLTNETFRRLHHSQRETINGFRQWCVRTSRFVTGGNNERVHQRLAYVLSEYRARGLNTRQNLVRLAEEALAIIPPLPPSC